MVVKIMVPFWVLSLIRHLIFRDPEVDHNFDNHPFSLDGPYRAVWEGLQVPCTNRWHAIEQQGARA